MHTNSSPEKFNQTTVKAEQAGFSSCMESEESLIPESFLDNHSKRSFRPSALSLLSTRANVT